MEFLHRYKLLLQSISFVLLLVPSGVAGVIYLVEKFRGVEVTMVSISILWFILPPPIIGIALLIIIAIYGRRPMEIFDIEIEEPEFGTSESSGYPQLSSKRILRLGIYINVIPGEWVNNIKLQFANNLIPTEWKPDYISPNVTTGGYFYFEIPDTAKGGNYPIRVIATTKDNGKKKSKKYNIEIPE